MQAASRLSTEILQKGSYVDSATVVMSENKGCHRRKEKASAVLFHRITCQAGATLIDRDLAPPAAGWPKSRFTSSSNTGSSTCSRTRSALIAKRRAYYSVSSIETSFRVRMLRLECMAPSRCGCVLLSLLASFSPPPSSF